MKSISFNNELWNFLRTLTEYLITDFRPIAEEHGLTLMQTRILLEIRDGEHHTVGSLGEIIGLSSGNASSAFKKLEKAGYLKRIRNPKDERYVQLALTKEGQDIINKIGDALEQRYGNFIKSKNEADFQSIFTCMRQLRTFIQEMSEMTSDQ